MTVFITSIVGTRFCDPSAVTLVGALPKGSTVLLRRERDNTHDRNAIRIYYGDTHIGYIPAIDAADIAPVLDRTPATSFAAQVTDEAIVDRGDIRFVPKLTFKL
jgi:hypothetical protein